MDYLKSNWQSYKKKSSRGDRQGVKKNTGENESAGLL